MREKRSQAGKLIDLKKSIRTTDLNNNRLPSRANCAKNSDNELNEFSIKKISCCLLSN
jgi:hypothetical protein